MSAGHAYERALGEIPGAAKVGLKAAVEAMKDGDLGIAATCLRTVADLLEEETDP